MPISFKKLFLDCTQIDAAVKGFNSNAVVTGPTTKGTVTEYVVAIDGATPATLHFYFRDDSTTTIQPTVGQNQELSQSIAEYVVQQCSKKVFQQKPLVLSTISKEDWDWLLTHLKDDHGYEVVLGKLPHGVRYDIKKNRQDQVNLNRYDNGRFMMQGKALEVYSNVAMALCDLVPNKSQIITAQLESYEVANVDASALIDEVNEHLPTGARILGTTGTAILAPALALMKLEIRLPDYSAIAYHALRALESYMKALMARHGYPVLNQAGFGNYFFGERLKSGVRDKIGCLRTIEAIEGSYCLYNEHRPSLFHVDANIESSRVLDDKSEAMNIAHQVMRTIENTAMLIPQ